MSLALLGSAVCPFTKNNSGNRFDCLQDRGHDTEKEFYSQQHREQALKREGSIDVKTAAVKFHTRHRSISNNF